MAGSYKPVDDLSALRVIGMWIDASYRGLGIVKDLIEMLESNCKSSKITTTQLAVVLDNKPAQRAYLKIGFKDTDEKFPLNNNPAKVCVRMTKAFSNK